MSKDVAINASSDNFSKSLALPESPHRNMQVTLLALGIILTALVVVYAILQFQMALKISDSFNKSIGIVAGGSALAIVSFVAAFLLWRKSDASSPATAAVPSKKEADKALEVTGVEALISSKSTSSQSASSRSETSHPSALIKPVDGPGVSTASSSVTGTSQGKVQSENGERAEAAIFPPSQYEVKKPHKPINNNQPILKPLGFLKKYKKHLVDCLENDSSFGNASSRLKAEFDPMKEEGKSNLKKKCDFLKRWLERWNRHGQGTRETRQLLKNSKIAEQCRAMNDEIFQALDEANIDNARMASLFNKAIKMSSLWHQRVQEVNASVEEQQRQGTQISEFYGQSSLSRHESYCAWKDVRDNVQEWDHDKKKHVGKDLIEFAKNIFRQTIDRAGCFSGLKEKVPVWEGEYQTIVASTDTKEVRTKVSSLLETIRGCTKLEMTNFFLPILKLLHPNEYWIDDQIYMYANTEGRKIGDFFPTTGEYTFVPFSELQKRRSSLASPFSSSNTDVPHSSSSSSSSSTSSSSSSAFPPSSSSSSSSSSMLGV